MNFIHFPYFARFKNLKFVCGFFIFIGFFQSFDVSAQVVKLSNGWSFTSNVDKMTDQNRSWFAKYNGVGSLFFKCYGKGSYQPAWLFGKYLTDKATFMYRFDKDSPVSVDSREMGTNNKVIFLDSQKGFLERAFSAKLIIFQARDRDGDTITQEFELTGLKQALEQVNKAAPCP